MVIKKECDIPTKWKVRSFCQKKFIYRCERCCVLLCGLQYCDYSIVLFAYCTEQQGNFVYMKIIY